LFLFFFLFISSPAVIKAAYYNDYSDTLLVVNDNSTTSVAIGAYFKAARNLSDSQIVHITTVTTETVIYSGLSPDKQLLNSKKNILQIF
jgi:hypothetical protein